MRLTRVDLTDLATPQEIASALHAQIGDRTGAVHVIEIARALDIVEIRCHSCEGFEGMLLTDRVRSYGAIIANTSRGAPRTRYTIAHELGHFLMDWHEGGDPDGFT